MSVCLCQMYAPGRKVRERQGALGNTFAVIRAKSLRAYHFQGTSFFLCCTPFLDMIKHDPIDH